MLLCHAELSTTKRMSIPWFTPFVILSLSTTKWMSIPCFFMNRRGRSPCRPELATKREIAQGREKLDQMTESALNRVQINHPIIRSRKSAINLERIDFRGLMNRQCFCTRPQTQTKDTAYCCCHKYTIHLYYCYYWYY